MDDPGEKQMLKWGFGAESWITPCPGSNKGPLSHDRCSTDSTWHRAAVPFFNLPAVVSWDGIMVEGTALAGVRYKREGAATRSWNYLAIALLDIEEVAGAGR